MEPSAVFPCLCCRPCHCCRPCPCCRTRPNGWSRRYGQPQPSTAAPEPRRQQSGTIAALLALCLALLAPLAGAQVLETRISPLTPLDRQFMDSQRQLITEMTLRHYGGRCCRRVSELDFLQRLLDDRHVVGEQTSELQAMGVLLGDLLAAELDMHWVIFEDAKGRSRALQLGETDNFLFPVTMISRRREVGDRTPVTDIYNRAYDSIEAVRPPLPFQ